MAGSDGIDCMIASRVRAQQGPNHWTMRLMWGEVTQKHCSRRRGKPGGEAALVYLPESRAAVSLVGGHCVPPGNVVPARAEPSPDPDKPLRADPCLSFAQLR